MINAKDKLDQIPPFAGGQSCKSKDRVATYKVLRGYRSITGKLLYICRLFSPTIAFHTLQEVTKCNNVRLLHLQALIGTLRRIKKCPCVITFLLSDGHELKLEAMSDATMCTRDDKKDVRERIIIFRSKGRCCIQSSRQQG